MARTTTNKLHNNARIFLTYHTDPMDCGDHLTFLFVDIARMSGGRPPHRAVSSALPYH